MPRPSPRLALVAPAIPLPYSSPQAYTYALPGTYEPELYTRVTIPFGRRTVPGIIVDITRKKVPYRLKELQPGSALQLTAHQVAFGEWIARTMQGGLGYTLRLFYPPLSPKIVQSPPHPRTVARFSPAHSPTTPHVYLESNRQQRWQVIREQVAAVTETSAQVLIIVPEKWLVAAWAEQVNDSTWAFVDSNVTPRVYTQVWQAVQAGTIRVVVGTQKALFLPFQQLGLIVIEEDFYDTHKLWDQYPRLHNVYGAQVLAQIHRAQLAYSSSFPSLALAHQLQQKKALALRNHPQVPHPKVMGLSPTDYVKRSLLPQEFVSQLKAWLRAGERVVVLHNARGTWATALCRSCHHAVRCVNCGVAMRVEGTAKHPTLVCRHCDRVEPLPEKCPNCQKGRLSTFGPGSDKITDIFSALFPQTSLVSITADTKDEPLPPQPAHAGQLIVGTTALFGVVGSTSVDRAVYLFPERSLLYPDFRSGERSFAMLIRLQQLIANPRRAVTVVTRKSQLINETLALPVKTVVQRQLLERKRLHYPPFTDLVVLTTQGRTLATATARAVAVREQLEERLPKDSASIIRGPYTGFVKKRRTEYEVHVLLLGELKELTHLYNHLPVDVVDVAPARIL